ncbi:phosphatidate cytidylyltransferase [Qipengyuania marisflavi]|uniref:phosphatidate cytidylyltransferase n=1 Tax=Qipengyuania marisflavi TaxID=2486356 RepID=UPI001FEB5A3F|nr:phosphatidate cytidylyltransferase [Qipengyuania marisflavi]
MADVEQQTAPQPKKNADLPVRLASAIAMLALAGGALWMGGQWLDLFILVVVLATLVELVLLVVKATTNIPYRLGAILAGTIYVGLAGIFLSRFPVAIVIGVVGAVICVDTFAYFFGRTLGGPKIAPRISQSKTWAGLLGGIIGATAWVAAWIYTIARATSGDTTMPFDGMEMLQILAIGTAVAVAAQAGDFFESWLKRKAGVKDSSRIIPGHGGVFDRTDGLIPVVLLAGGMLGAAV